MNYPSILVGIDFIRCQLTEIVKKRKKWAPIQTLNDGREQLPDLVILKALKHRIGSIPFSMNFLQSENNLLWHVNGNGT